MIDPLHEFNLRLILLKHKEDSILFSDQTKQKNADSCFAGDYLYAYKLQNIMKISMKISKLLATVLLVVISSSSFALAARPSVELRFVGTHATGIFGLGAAEIVAHDPETQRLFVVNGGNSTIDVLETSNQGIPTYLFSIDIEPFGDQANSVDVCNGVVAAAVQADVKTDNGTVEFFDVGGGHLKSAPAGALPDMLTFTPNCQKVLVANEGEPNSYNQASSVDPEGSVTIVDLNSGVVNATSTNVGFTEFNGTTLAPSIRIFGPNATIAQDLEPEYIAVDHNSKTAWVTLQENNAIGILDLKKGEFTKLVGLGFKDYTAGENKLDASDRDVPGSSNNGIINIGHWPVFGMYQPDGIASLKYKNDTFLVTANEGDARDYTGFSEEVRVGSLTLDTSSFAAQGYPDVSTGASGLRNNDNLGRLNVTRTLGNTDADADFEKLYTLGGRSFSIWNAAGELVFDSGDDIEQITADALPLNFNTSNDDNLFDGRSDNKGPEPEGVTIGKAYGRTYAFIGLERIGGVLVYEVTDPYDVKFVQYVNNRNFAAAISSTAALDLGPEGLHFISEDDSPTGVPLLAVANEVSGTTTVYEFVQAHQIREFRNE